MERYSKIIADINKELFKEGLGSAFFFKRKDGFLLVSDNPLFDSLGGYVLHVGEIIKDGTLIGEWHIRKRKPFTSEELEGFKGTLAFLNKEVFFEEWEYTYQFVQNRGCAYFPCHEIEDENLFNCLFCYCPLYLMEDCGGNKRILPNGVKDCSYCLVPHRKENYKRIVEKLRNRG